MHIYLSSCILVLKCCFFYSHKTIWSKLKQYFAQITNIGVGKDAQKRKQGQRHFDLMEEQNMNTLYMYVGFLLMK